MILDEVDVLDRSEERFGILFAFTVKDVDFYKDDPRERHAAVYLIEILAVNQDLILVGKAVRRCDTCVIDSRLAVSAEPLSGFLHHYELVSANIFPALCRIIIITLRLSRTEQPIDFFDN